MKEFFEFFVYLRTAEGTTSDSLVYWGGRNGDSLMGKEFCVKNLPIIYLFCCIEKRLPLSCKMNDMNKLQMNFPPAQWEQTNTQQHYYRPLCSVLC